MNLPATPTRRTGICLNMIVKNEVKVLDRLFRSVQDYIDYYVIVDTGSSDGTPDFIRNWMDAAGIEGEIHQRAWVNFGHNRQQALELAVAANRGDWLLFIDADEELVVADTRFHEKMEAGVSYSVEKHHGALRYAVPNLLDVRHNRWRWAGPVHNYLQHLEGENREALRKDLWIVYHSGEGAKSHGLTPRQKFLRDAKILEGELRKNPQDTRSQFYLAQSYKHAGEDQKAAQAYRKRAGMEGYHEEKFIAQLEVGRLAIRLGRDQRVVLRELLKAYELRANRAEPLHELARYFRERSLHARAYVFASTGSVLPRPQDRLFVEVDVYSWRLLDELAVAAYWTGRYAESKACGEEILRRAAASANIDPQSMTRIHQNIAFANARLDEVAA